MARISKEEARSAAFRQKTYSPKIDPLDYTASLLRYLNYHNAHTDSKVIRGWAVEYLRTHFPKKASIVSRASDYELKTIGVIANALVRKEPIAEEDVKKIEQDVENLFEKYKNNKEEVKQEKKTPSEQEVQKAKEDKNAILASEIAGEINHLLDEFMLTGKEGSAKAVLQSKNASAQVAKLVAEKFVRITNEVKEALEGNDSQLKEGYSNFGKVKLKKFYAFLQQIQADCLQQTATAKVQRKPRVKKEKPASVIVAKMKYKKEEETLKLTSESPEKIVGATEVWLYDTQNRNVIYVEADKGQKLTVKGTTILGISLAETVKKKLRKPEEFFNMTITKQNLTRAFKAVKTKPQAFTGRVNEHMIILKVV